MTTQQNKAITRSYYEDHADLEAAFKNVSPQAIPHVSGTPTYEVWKGMHQLFISAFPDMKLAVEDEVAEGDQVVTRWVMHATHKGDLMGIPATGRQVAMSGISIDRVAEGKIVEHWGEFDMLGLMQQLGVVPTPESA
jgi:predicted ester cyclase